MYPGAVRTGCVSIKRTFSVDSFVWDGGNIPKVEAHDVTPTEAEDALLDPRRIATPVSRVTDERRWGVIGATSAGRILRVIFSKWENDLRIITSFDANDKEKRRYRGT
ncbi:MAG: BrnT family toxin [Dehalococcoidia bacterium]